MNKIKKSDIPVVNTPKFSQGEWSACHKGKCPCKQVWTDDYPIAEITVGKWGDDYPALRIVGESSLNQKVEAYMEMIEYGEVSEETAQANALLISAAPNMYKALKRIIEWLNNQAVRDEEAANEENQFITLKDAHLADAKNYRAMAKDLSRAINKAEGK